jgi:hypothetical protein
LFLFVVIPSPSNKLQFSVRSSSLMLNRVRENN